MHTYLKIKIKSLAEEARIIRAEERKFKAHPHTPTRRKIFWGLREHRIGIVRTEARAALIAYGFLLGVTYSAIERNPRSSPDAKRALALVMKYGEPRTGIAEDFEAWLKAPAENSAETKKAA